MSLANGLRILKAYASETATQIGAGLGSAIRHVVVWLNGLMKYVLKAAQAFAVFMQTIFGKYKGGASGVNLDGALLDAEDSAGDLADSAEGAASGLDDADASAKKLKKDLAVLPFDELNQLAKDQEQASSPKGGAGGGGGIGGLGDLGDLGDGLFDTAVDDITGKLSELQSFVDRWAEKIKKAFKAKDWEALGKAIAWGLNRGIDELYKVLDPKKAKEKIDPFITAFVTTLNSLIGAIKWYKLGSSIGRGINILVDAMNGLIDPKTGIDFGQIGKSFASGLNGIVDEVNFKNLGTLLGNKFMITWTTLKGFADEFNWKGIGRALGQTVNGINDAIKWETVADAMTTSLNGAFDSLKEFSKTVEWRKIATNVASGINKAIGKFKWSENGKALNDFLLNLVDTLVVVAKKTNWYKLGKGIGDFLSELEWDKILFGLAEAFMTAFWGLLEGLSDTTAGKFVIALGSALAAVKVMSAVDSFTANIATALTGTESVGVVKGAITSLFKSASGGAAAGLGGITTAIAPIAGAVVGVTALIGFAEIAGKHAEQNIIGEFTNIKEDAEDLNERIDKLKENTTSLVAQAKRNADADAKLAEPFIKVIEDLSGKTTLTKDEMDKLHDAVDGLNGVYPGLNLQIETTTGKLSLGVNEIKAYISNLKNIAIAEVYMDKAKEAAEHLVEADENLATAQRKYNALLGQHRDLELTRDKVIRNSVNGYIELNGKMVRSKDVLDELNQQLENNETKQGEAKLAVDECQKAYDNADRSLGNYAANVQKYTTSVGDDTESMSTRVTTSVGTTTTALDTAVDDASTKGAKIPSNLAEGLDNARDVAVTSINTMLNMMKDKAKEADFKTPSKGIPEGVAEGIRSGRGEVIGAVGSMSEEALKAFKTQNGINSPATKYSAQSKYIPEGVKKGILDNKSQAISAMTTLISGLLTEFKNKALGAGGLSTQMNQGGKKITTDFIKGLKEKGGFSAKTYYDGFFNNDLWSKLSNIGSKMYKKGRDISQQFADGLKSVSIPVPEIDVSSWTAWSVATATETINFSIPSFSAKWRYYAKGGLFTKPLAGILGEAGDEAAIPLENQKTMNRIAQAIVDNSNGAFGMSEDQIASAVARGYVQAMMSNQGNERPIDVYATLYTEDNEVLARAVQRGNRSMDYRNNATPRFN